jgi:hypothetical protein
MSLWAKRIGQLSIVTVALFFFNCQEDTSVLGFRNPNGKFKVNYVDIPLESSIYLRDSLRTSNYSYSGEVNRFLVGQYTDPIFGDVAASVFTQYFSANYSKIGSTAAFDSVTLELQLDFYAYGSNSILDQDISIYELDEVMSSDSLLYYHNDSNVPYTKQLGTKSFSIDPEALKALANGNDRDSIITIKVPLITSFGQKIFDSAVRYRDAVSKEDSVFVTYSEFVKQFKGIAIKPTNGDKIIGFSPVGPGTKIVVHYHEATEDSLSFSMSMSGVIGFSQIKSNRSSTELSDVSVPYQEYEPDTENRYIESGVGILTKLDLGNFYAFADTVPNIMINSAEIFVEANDPGIYEPPAGFALRLLKDNNRMKRFDPDVPGDVTDYLAYGGYLTIDAATQGTPVVDSDSVLYANDRSPLLQYNSSTKSYAAFLTLFIQQLTLEDSKTKFRNFVLYPVSQPAATPMAQSGFKAVNRVVFSKDKIRLRVYYTKPTANL